jgi:hypothetical protein
MTDPGDAPDLEDAHLVEMLDLTADYPCRPVESYNTVNELSHELRRWAARLLPSTNRLGRRNEHGDTD